MIEYPSDEAITEQRKAQGLTPAVLVRDLVRVVEVLNLKRKGFFNKRSVLAGSMALRCYGSPRFTIYDADFSTRKETIDPPTVMKKMLAYEDAELIIAPPDITPHDKGGTAWEAPTVDFSPDFTLLVPEPSDRTFKIDLSFRGVILPAVEKQLLLPYDLDIFTGDTPTVHVMDPQEIVAEKILGWCGHGGVKHYADLAFIAMYSRQEDEATRIPYSAPVVLAVLEEKLRVMTSLQPDYYEQFPDVDALINRLAADPSMPDRDWAKLVYVLPKRDMFSRRLIQQAVQEILVPSLRAALRSRRRSRISPDGRLATRILRPSP